MYHSFIDDSGQAYGSFEVYLYDPGYTGSLPKGWYWQSCFPGCLPDSEPVGPFTTESEAFSDAREVQTMRIHVDMPHKTHTETGKRKVWYTNGKQHPQYLSFTYACSLDPVVFVYEKNTKHNDYNGWSGYISPKYIEVLK